uniref:HMG box domain-containing protein n=1 Tax=Strigamia maritima TaxID=126957 RepID=T1JHA4_STRMM
MQRNLPLRKRAYSFPADDRSPISSQASQSSCYEDSFDEVVDDAFVNSAQLTPEDTTAIFVLSTMAKHKSCVAPVLSPPLSPTKPNKDFSRSKRPMNAFMLFAQKFRLEYTQQYPGKDNRAISVLLGDTWKKMKAEERNIYGQEARRMAEEQKKLHPDCWKRRRTTSTT